MLQINGVDFVAEYGSFRPDVARHFDNESFAHSGFTLTLDPALLPGNPESVVKLKVYSGLTNGFYEASPLRLAFAEQRSTD